MQYFFFKVNGVGENAEKAICVPPFRTREVAIPRFKLEQNYDLIANLKEMGLTDLFQESGDFSAMTSDKVHMSWVSKGRISPEKNI